jgi:CheY-like chemotaxis protein
MTESIPEQGMTLLILVVDDEPDVELLFRQHFRRDLRQGRFTMEFAQSGDIALQRITDAAGVSLILILSDINMPGMTGLEPKAASARRPSHHDYCLWRCGDQAQGIGGGRRSAT